MLTKREFEQVEMMVKLVAEGFPTPHIPVTSLRKILKAFTEAPADPVGERVQREIEGTEDPV